KRSEQRLVLAKLDEASARLCRLDLLLELPRGPGADGALGVRVELDDADAAIAPQVHTRRHRNDDRVRAGGEQRECDDAGESFHCASLCWFAGRQTTPAARSRPTDDDRLRTFKRCLKAIRASMRRCAPRRRSC